MIAGNASDDPPAGAGMGGMIMGKQQGRRNGQQQHQDRSQRRTPPEGVSQRTQMQPDQRQDDELPVDADTDLPQTSQQDKQRNQPR